MLIQDKANRQFLPANPKKHLKAVTSSRIDSVIPRKMDAFQFNDGVAAAIEKMIADIGEKLNASG
jgi:hypothetical protein